MEKLMSLTKYIRNISIYINVPPKYVQKAQLCSKSDDENLKQKLEAKTKTEEALKKLNNILNTMISEEVANSSRKLNLAKPKLKNRRLMDFKEKNESKPVGSPEKQIKKVVRDVAETVGGDIKQTESELLTKLLDSSTNNAASNLGDIVKGMIVEEPSKADQVRRILQQSQKTGLQRKRQTGTQNTYQVLEKINLFGSETLGIFTNIDQSATEGVQNEVWNKLYERDLKLAITHPPSNYFQQMILWTEQEKVWKFPIDNEQGLGEEQQIYFTEHVFLEKHLEPWCPQKGPLRHFMELVCVGLSKNPYLTVDAKKEHIEWFKNYFEDKNKLLKEVGLSLNSTQALSESKKME